MNPTLSELDAEAAAVAAYSKLLAEKMGLTADQIRIGDLMALAMKDSLTPWGDMTSETRSKSVAYAAAKLLRAAVSGHELMFGKKL